MENSFGWISSRSDPYPLQKKPQITNKNPLDVDT